MAGCYFLRSSVSSFAWYRPSRKGASTDCATSTAGSLGLRFASPTIKPAAKLTLSASVRDTLRFIFPPQFQQLPWRFVGIPSIGKNENHVVRTMSLLCKQYVPGFTGVPEGSLSKNDLKSCVQYGVFFSCCCHNAKIASDSSL